MFACRPPIWRLDDFSLCFQLDYIDTLFPLIICATSLLYLFVQIVLAIKSSRAYQKYQPLNSLHHVWDIRVPVEETGHSPFLDDDTGSDTEADQDEHLALRTTITQESVIEVDRPRGEVLLVIIEEAAVLGELGIHLAVLLLGTWGRRGQLAAISQIASWTYVSILASCRLLLSSSSRLSFPRLWYHTAFIYGFFWSLSALRFRSSIIHPISKLSKIFCICDFALNTLLVTIALTSRKGNRAVKLEYEGDLEPSKEQVASVFSLATFTWVDSIVWRGYQKTLELSDVWNLAPRDKAAALLADYRQLKKVSSLAWHLMKYFKRGLLIQAAWAAFSGFLTFAPTLLLKAILEYVENPSMIPRNAAWFYVILLFVSGVASALADGQALWIGRKICIRLRAIIIGEIYAKALKRKASASVDKILGEKRSEEKAETGRLKRILTFRRKRKTDKPDAKKGETKEEGQVSSGTIINLMAVDSFKVSEICAYLHFLWASTPIQLVVCIVLLYRILGYSSIAGLGMMVVLLPVNMFISQRFAKIQKQILAATDARIHTTNEVLSNIRIIKFFAWEQRFMGLVNETRSLELRHLRRRYILWGFAATVWSGAPILITFLSFLVYTKVEKKDLVPSIAFTALSLFQILRIPLDQLADMIAHVQESKVSVDRVEEFLMEPETDKYAQLKDEKYDEDGQPVIGFEQATFTWGSEDQESESFRLLDLDLTFHLNQLNVIVGPTGCGKTSMLMALLGEMSLLEGSVYLPGGKSREDQKPDSRTGLTETVAYCAQQVWLVNATIKENIIFAGKWDAQRYKDVLVACSLERDLEILDNGDETLVGEKGVTLSGGQKQRISLARALYSRARYVLLDDVLSAVDSHTAKWIFDQALLGPLMYERTCILVTHNISLCVPHSDYVVVLDNGRVAAEGSPNEVIDSGKLSEDLSKSRPVSRGPSRIASRVPSDVGGDEAIGEAVRRRSSGQTNRDANVPNGTLDTSKAKVKQDDTETKAEGGVKLSIIFLYLSAMGPWWYWVMAALGFLAQQSVSVATNVWIREWANAYATKSISSFGMRHSRPISHFNPFSGLGTCLRSGTCNWGVPSFGHAEPSTYSAPNQYAFGGEVDANYYLGVYAAIGLVFMVITLLREGILFMGALYASRRIHQRLMEAVMRAKFRFFDSTPLGQIMNRFSKDIESIDQEIAPVAIGVVHCLASIITIVILISVITPGFLIAGTFITILYFLIGKFYINSSRDLKRLESVQRSPLYQQFGETLSGMATIRAYGDERRFIRENLAKINTHNRPFIFLWAANRWLAFRVDVVGAMVAFFTGVFVVLSVGRIDAGAAGLAMTYAVTFTENVLWFVRLYAANEQNMNSVERIKEYLDVEQEAAAVTQHRPPSNWPTRGSVEFIAYSTRYRKDFDLVLKNITFKIMPGEKVGVVGRTGAGKSSLALALFRALEAEEGKILVDDVDIGLIGLQDLRENIVMVPQDPTLFTGTIRSNLDPFGLFTDDEIFNALRRVQLVGLTGPPSKATTPSRPSTPVVKQDIKRPTSAGQGPEATSNGRPASSDPTIVPSSDTSLTIPAAENKNLFLNLSHPVAESGSNLSQGQRQLLCLARALLKSPKVLLMDEATASIDYATDAKIQETIREIKNTTITIAHRLNTIIDYDKVLVLDKGALVEYGSPYELIGKKDGVFRGMCDMSGEGELLRGLAKKAAEAKQLLDVPST